jgi:hypothetical protein
MSIVNYKVFSNSIVFVEWQKENMPEIISVQPYAQPVNIRMESKDGTGVFVTFIEDVTR